MVKNNKIVIINGLKYDATTGLPVAKSTPVVKTPGIPAKSLTKIKNIESLAQKSQAIYNRTAKKIVSDISVPVRKIGKTMDIARSKSISHFAPLLASTSSPSVSSSEKKRKQMDIGPIKHPIATKLDKKHSQTALGKSRASLSAKEIKNKAINEALHKTSSQPTSNPSFFKRHSRFINIFSLSLVMIILAGYLTYLSVPSLSVRIASAQAGINATYPEYSPDGYSTNGPVTYTDGEVVINFKANTDDNQFSIKQSRSSWDSSAVKNKVNKDSNGQFITTEEHGLTIYTYNGNATWVNGGILYSITGNAPLSGDQIRRIATSL